MPSSKRRRQSSVIQRLLDEPYRFELTQALRIIERWLRLNGVRADSALLSYVRFQNSLSMSFPASQIEGLAPVAEGPSDTDQRLQAALAAKQLKRLTLTPAFFGFFGASGAMPNCYTEGVANQVQARKYEGTRAFFDIFYNRIMALRHQALTKHQVRHCVDSHGDAAALPIQLALAGSRPRPAADVAAGDAVISGEVLAYYAALLRHRPASAKLVETVLTGYFGVPIRVEQFVGGWDTLRDHELIKLGTQNTKISHGAMLGTRCWGRHARVRVHIGPAGRADFERFLPNSDGHKALKAMLGLFSTPTIEFDARLILRVADVKPCRLQVASPPRLGVDAVLLTAPAKKDLVIALRL